MRKLISKLEDRRGISFLEVMIALIITGVVTTAILKAYITQHKHYLVQESVTDMQQNARASIDELARHIRMAGYDVPNEMQAITASNTNPDTIIINYNSSGCNTTLKDPMPQPSAELKCIQVHCFQQYMDQEVYIYDPITQTGEFFIITQVQEAAAQKIQHNTTVLSKSYSPPAYILALSQLKFYVDNTTDSSYPNLMVKVNDGSPQVYAENISDLQFQYRMKNGLVVDQPVLSDDIREVLISVTGRTREPDPDEPFNPYRQRTFATSVNLRNIGS